MTTLETRSNRRLVSARSLGALVLAEARMVSRDYANLLLPLGLPVLVLITSASMAGAEPIPGTGFTALELFVLPIVGAMVLAYIGLVNMPSFLAHYRKDGVLRRLGVTPVSPALVLVAQVVVSAIQAVVGIAIALAVAVFAFDAAAPAAPFTLIAVFLLSMATMSAMGMVIAAIAPSTNAAIAIGVLSFLTLGALGGMFGGRQVLPEALQEVSQFLPFGAAADVMGAAWAGVQVPATGSLSLIAVLILGSVAAVAWFRWE